MEVGLGFLGTFNTKYYYVVGIGHTERKFWFITPEVGPDATYTFGLIGDLGQTYDSNKTLTHYELNPRKGQAVLFVGDLSYADQYPNHDNGETKPFKPCSHRYHVPYESSGSTSPFCYNYHYMEGETMRVMNEPWFLKYRVDVVFAGHVHAYERSERVSNVAYNIVNGICKPVKDQSAPVYITIGDGGNIEGLATNMTEPQPDYSAYREASFGHATFDIKNRTHAYYSWHRNQDGYAVKADSIWFFNRFYHPVDDSTTAKS
ncbi:hypothetical protein ACFX2F_002876 [Malus domestica]|uniref:Purple acid phosphatase C-terminal domain-containing protein n=1 Tax=Malus domestica TaxID=3750 RepID=A0A498J143_MALDO|nr:hypothetical protein DVH24_042436 [Malus domestica]